MNTPRNWTPRDLDGLFNRAAVQIESVARDFSEQLVDVSMAIDIESHEPVIRFIFADNTAPDLERMPQNINGHRVVPTFKT